MALMEFLKANWLNTTTMAKVDSNTATVQYLFDRNLGLAYSSVGYTGATKTTISIEFGTSRVLSHVLINNHNMKDYRIYYNSVTANTFTPDINVTANSATSSYYSFASITVSSIQLQIDSAFTSVERSVGELLLSERRLQFTRNPSVADWKPNVRRKQIVHDMPDGGVRVYNIRNKFQAKLKWSYITQAFHDSLETIHTESLPLYFVPFPTTTAWDADAFEVLWIGDFNFKHGDNSKTQGFNGEIDIRQTAGG